MRIPTKDCIHFNARNRPERIDFIFSPINFEKIINNKKMDYYGQDEDERNNIKILKYMLLCTLILLKIGLITLFIRYLITIFVDNGKLFFD